MKAIVYHDYGSPDVLRCEVIDVPVPGDDEVLIRVRAASLNPLDWHGMKGTPYVARILGGIRKPGDTRLGADLAGVVEAVGKNVTGLKPGDEVYGTSRGTLAEYVNASEKKLALKPANLTFEQAAAVPVGALTALQGLRDKGRIQRGQKVLINGAAGGVGTFAVQIARMLGAEVTGVCSTRNVDMVHSLGAHDVVDYTLEDFTRDGQQYDLIIDCVGNHTFASLRRIMTPKGYLVVVTGPKGPWFGPISHMLKAALVNLFVSQNVVPFIADVNRKDLDYLRELIESRKLTPVVEHTYPMTDISEAMRHLETGHARGKLVVSMDPDDRT